jgi:hypothetical protein
MAILTAQSVPNQNRRTKKGQHLDNGRARHPRVANCGCEVDRAP